MKKKIKTDKVKNINEYKKEKKNKYKKRKNRKVKKVILRFGLIIVCFLIIIININVFVMASEITVKTPGDNQFLELRAVEVKDVEGQNKQLTMELWTNSIEFERICS